MAIDDGRASPPVPNLLRRFWSALTVPSAPAGALVTAPAADLANAGQLLIASLVEAMPYPAIALDGELRVLAFNPAAREIVPPLRIREPLFMVLRMPELGVRLGSVDGGERGGQVDQAVLGQQHVRHRLRQRRHVRFGKARQQFIAHRQLIDGPGDRDGVLPDIVFQNALVSVKVRVPGVRVIFDGILAHADSG